MRRGRREEGHQAGRQAGGFCWRREDPWLEKKGERPTETMGTMGREKTMGEMEKEKRKGERPVDTFGSIGNEKTKEEPKP